MQILYIANQHKIRKDDMMVKVGIIAGSLRKDSFSKKIAQKAKELFPAGFEAELIDISNLPVYNEDYDSGGNPPEGYTSFRNKMKEVDAVLFVTPEYNRSMPPALKNALDVGPRPYGDSVWEGKPAAIISQSPGRLSGFGANHHLRQVLVFLNMPVVQQPETYIGIEENSFDSNGNLVDERIIASIEALVDAFVELIKKYKS